MKTPTLIKLCIASLIITMFSGCTSERGNIKYTPWNLETSTPIADPNISSIQTQITSKSSYWSILYLFALYEIDKKYAGFDILYFIDFTKRYRSDVVAYESDAGGNFFESLIPSRTERLRKMTLNKMCVKTNYDVVLTPMYRLESFDLPILWQESDIRVRAFASKIRGFTVRGRKLDDAYMPNNADGPKNAFMLKADGVTAPSSAVKIECPDVSSKLAAPAIRALQ